MEKKQEECDDERTTDGTSQRGVGEHEAVVAPESRCLEPAERADIQAKQEDENDVRSTELATDETPVQEAEVALEPEPAADGEEETASDSLVEGEEVSAEEQTADAETTNLGVGVEKAAEEEAEAQLKEESDKDEDYDQEQDADEHSAPETDEESMAKESAVTETVAFA